MSEQQILEIIKERDELLIQNRRLVEALELALPIIHEYGNSGIYDRDNRKMVHQVETDVKKALNQIK